jgi:hypothetical protein
LTSPSDRQFWPSKLAEICNDFKNRTERVGEFFESVGLSLPERDHVEGQGLLSIDRLLESVNRRSEVERIAVHIGPRSLAKVKALEPWVWKGIRVKVPHFGDLLFLR